MQVVSPVSWLCWQCEDIDGSRNCHFRITPSTSCMQSKQRSMLQIGACYAEIAHVLKPGGVFGVYEWAMTKSFDVENASHVDIRQRIERGDGVTNMRDTEQCLQAFRKSGLQLYHNGDNRALMLGPDKRRWWFPIDGDLRAARSFADAWLTFRLEKAFWNIVYYIQWIFERLKLSRRGTLEALRTQWMYEYCWISRCDHD